VVFAAAVRGEEEEEAAAKEAVMVTPRAVAGEGMARGVAAAAGGT